MIAIQGNIIIRNRPFQIHCPMKFLIYVEKSIENDININIFIIFNISLHGK